MSKTTLEQDRAAHAFKCVEQMANQAAKQAELASCYRSYAESLPTHIVMGGIGQAMATEWAAARSGEGESDKPGRRAHAQLANDLAAWLSTRKIYDNVAFKDAGRSLIEAMMKGDQDKYLRAQAEALAWLVWLKKFCQATLPKSKSNEE